jgi:hypothetical protein
MPTMGSGYRNVGITPKKLNLFMGTDGMGNDGILEEGNIHLFRDSLLLPGAAHVIYKY